MLNVASGVISGPWCDRRHGLFQGVCATSRSPLRSRDRARTGQPVGIPEPSSLMSGPDRPRGRTGARLIRELEHLAEYRAEGGLVERIDWMDSTSSSVERVWRDRPCDRER